LNDLELKHKFNTFSAEKILFSRWSIKKKDVLLVR